MKIDIYDIVTHARHCGYCINHNLNQPECSLCSAPNNYYGKPSGFVAIKNIELVEDYFTLLEEYTKLLCNLGFEFKK
ncbi:MAG: hypothetical protein WCY33_03345 [Clostridia bacterium]